MFSLIDAAIRMNFTYTVLIGDFNFPTIDWEDWTTPHSTGSVVFQFLECLWDNFLYQFIDRPTRHLYLQSSNILDLCLTDKPEIINSIHYCSNLGASDHVSLFISLDCDASYDASNTVKRNYHKGDYEAIRLELSKTNWEIWGIHKGEN